MMTLPHLYMIMFLPAFSRQVRCFNQGMLMTLANIGGCRAVQLSSTKRKTGFAQQDHHCAHLTPSSRDPYGGDGDSELPYGFQRGISPDFSEKKADEKPFTAKEMDALLDRKGPRSGSLPLSPGPCRPDFSEEQGQGENSRAEAVRNKTWEEIVTLTFWDDKRMGSRVERLTPCRIAVELSNRNVFDCTCEYDNSSGRGQSPSENSENWVQLMIRNLPPSTTPNVIQKALLSNFDISDVDHEGVPVRGRPRLHSKVLVSIYLVPDCKLQTLKRGAFPNNKTRKSACMQYGFIIFRSSDAAKIAEDLLSGQCLPTTKPERFSEGIYFSPSRMSHEEALARSLGLYQNTAFPEKYAPIWFSRRGEAVHL